MLPEPQFPAQVGPVGDLLQPGKANKKSVSAKPTLRATALNVRLFPSDAGGNERTPNTGFLRTQGMAYGRGLQHPAW